MTISAGSWPREALDRATRLIAAGSPFLGQLLRLDENRLARLTGDPVAAAHADIVARQYGVGMLHRAGATRRDDAVRALRQNRNDHALLVALADLAGLWGLEQVVAALTAFANASVASAAGIALHDALGAGQLDSDEDHGSGLVLLAFGKHGAGELNYSSDIDLVVFYDPHAPALARGAEPARVYNRIAQTIAKLLAERTSDGYVHRVDYRLRPDPGSTRAAVSLPAAYTYYETLGQNWERAAMIKARPVAGDLVLGRRVLDDLAPFVWRKYFDFATIADIHAMKRQIHAVRGHGSIAVAGHDIKLGRGGIREIEFFVQTQQLVFGGRRPSLRGPRTLDMLAALEAEGWIVASARDELSAAYRHLRQVEHRLQMVADEQTQRLPVAADELARFAALCGYMDVGSFSADLTRHARRVQHHYALLFENAADLGHEAGDLVFTGADVDPATRVTLGRLGFRQPDVAAETVRGWHFGRRAAVTGARAREVLTELVPALLSALGGTPDPDGALARLDRAFARMPAAVELLTLLRSRAPLRTLFADLLGTAPRLAEMVAATPHVLDTLIDTDFATAAHGTDRMDADLQALIGHAVDMEDFLDRLRDAARQLNFLTGARMLSGILPPVEAGAAHAAIARAVVRSALDRVRAAFAAEHGTVAGARIAVVGLGRLGAGDLTATSDLDLLVVYDFDLDARVSDGDRPLDATAYHTRLTQRLIAALTAPTRRGRLYEVDMRLRPSGTKGPVASQLTGFVSYHQGEAELWEHMALTRAAVLAGDLDFAPVVERAIHAIMARPRDRREVDRAVLAMRALVSREKGAGQEWDLKLAPGGLLDLDFLAQAITLAHAHAHPELIACPASSVFVRAGTLGLLSAADAATLIEAYRLLDDVLHWQRLTLGGSVPEAAVGPGPLARIAALVGEPDPVRLKARLAGIRALVRSIFQRVLRPE